MPLFLDPFDCDIACIGPAFWASIEVVILSPSIIVNTSLSPDLMPTALNGVSSFPSAFRRGAPNLTIFILYRTMVSILSERRMLDDDMQRSCT